jgi:indolepyruvate ferredoxin oxidoreductase beta subunit
MVKCDVILAGVGGQGVLSIAAVIARPALAAGYAVRQSEVHGMAQRGGAVLAHLRISGGRILSDLIPRGGADLIISLEPLESLRYVPWLSPEGVLVTAAEPFLNIPRYPELSEILGAVRALPRFRIVEALSLAKEAGLPQAVNMVMTGAASPFLPLDALALEAMIGSMFAGKAPGAAEANRRAFVRGRAAVQGNL